MATTDYRASDKETRISVNATTAAQMIVTGTDILSSKEGLDMYVNATRTAGSCTVAIQRWSATSQFWFTVYTHAVGADAGTGTHYLQVPGNTPGRYRLVVGPATSFRGLVTAVLWAD